MMNLKFVKIITDIAKGTFLESLQQNERISELNELHIEEKQRVIFAIALNYEKEPKKAEEIFMVIKVLTNNAFFELPHYENGENANGVLIPTALHLAAKSDCGKEVFDIILGQGIDINRLDFAGSNYGTALDVAIRMANEKAFDALIAAGAEIYRDTTIALPPGTAPLISILYNRGHVSEKVLLRMTQKLLTKGANPNIRIFFDKWPAFMDIIRSKEENSKVDFFKLYLTSPKLDLSCCGFNFSKLEKITALDLVTSEDKEMLEVRQLLQDHIKNRFATRLVLIEKEMAVSVELPNSLKTLCSEYACADEGFENYGTTEKSLSFLYNITKDEDFSKAVSEQRKKVGAKSLSI